MLVLHIIYERNIRDRKTIADYTYSFRKYATDHRHLYINAALPLPLSLKNIPADLIIFHYTFVGQKWAGQEHFLKVQTTIDELQSHTAHKVAINQDEYYLSNAVCDFCKRFNIKSFITLLPEKEWQKVYPYEKSGIEQFIFSFAGYIDEEEIKYLNDIQPPHFSRKIDISYRARKVPYWLGEHGQIKYQIGEAFLTSPKTSQLNCDISSRESDVFYGRNWLKFLANSRTALGCLGGASLHDPDGNIRSIVDLYVKSNPKALFAEVKKACFNETDNNLEYFAISPRHFECCITKTCQILMKGNYFGVLKPNIDYIELKPDYSNLDQVIVQIKDPEFTQIIANNAFNNVVQSGKYTYRYFAKDVFHRLHPRLILTSSPNFIWNFYQFLFIIHPFRKFLHQYFSLLGLKIIINTMLRPLNMEIIKRKIRFIK
jgi:hypothetical protein